MEPLTALVLLAHLMYSKECCEGTHCHPIPCSEINSVTDGWLWKDYHFTRKMLRISPDGECHVCTSIVPLCIYLPAANS